MVFLINVVGDDPHRSALIPLYHMLVISKHTLYKKIGWTIFDIFFICVYVLFWGKIPVFLITGTRYRFESWKFGCAVKSYIEVMKITLIVLKEDFGLFSGLVPKYHEFSNFLWLWSISNNKNLFLPTPLKKATNFTGLGSLRMFFHKIRFSNRF